MHVHIYACSHIYMFTYMHAHTYACSHIYMRTYMQLCMLTCMHACSHNMQLCMLTYTHAHIYAIMHARMHAHIICNYACSHICMRTYMQLCMLTYTHTHIIWNYACSRICMLTYMQLCMLTYMNTFITYKAREISGCGFVVNWSSFSECIRVQKAIPVWLLICNSLLCRCMLRNFPHFLGPTRSTIACKKSDPTSDILYENKFPKSWLYVPLKIDNILDPTRPADPYDPWAIQLLLVWYFRWSV